MRFTIATLALAGVSAISTAAYAQETGQAQGPVSTPEANLATTIPPASPQGAEPATGLADIVVTAQRREESLQKVPVAVTAISAEQLDQLRVTNIKNLAAVAPSLQVATQGLQGNPSIAIRGISSGVANNAVDPKVGIYLDGVYIGRTVGAIFDLADIQRVEVLRGPQGTLFGRNATSGAISLVTSAPSGEFGVRGSASYGNYDAIRGKVTIDLPAFGPFTARVSYLHDEIEGDATNSLGGQTLDLRARRPEFGVVRFKNKLGGRNIDGVNVAVRGDFGDVTADYRFDYTDSRTVGRAVQSFGVIGEGAGALIRGVDAFQPLFGGTTNISNQRLNTVANATGVQKIVTQGHSLTFQVPVSDSVSLKSITAFRKFKEDPNLYDLAASGGRRFTLQQFGALLTGAAAAIPSLPRPGANDYFFTLLTARATSQRQFSEEFQAQVSTDAFDLTAGLFYFHERSPATDVLGIAAPTPGGAFIPTPFDAAFGSGVNRTLSVNDSWAAYGQATFHLTDTLDITGGLRGTIDDRELIIFQTSGGQGGTLGTGDFKQTFKKVNYTGIVTWRPTDRITTYAKIASGYVAGGILSGIPYQPETLVAYEVGLKAQAFDNRLRFNAAAFYSDYKDLQSQNFTNGRQTFDNAGSAEIKGFEVEAEFTPVQGLVLSGNVGYADLKYKTFIQSYQGISQDTSAVAETPYVSKWTGRIAAQYDAPEFENGAHLQARVEGRYRSSYFLTSLPVINSYSTTNPPGITPVSQRLIDPVVNATRKQPSFWLVDGRVGLVDLPIGGSRVSISAFAQNLLDEDYVGFGAPVLSIVGVYERGRTYGVELGFSF